MKTSFENSFVYCFDNLNIMKKNIALLLFLIILSSCSEKQDNFSKYEWIVQYKEYNEDFSKSKSHQRVLF